MILGHSCAMENLLTIAGFNGLTLTRPTTGKQVEVFIERKMVWKMKGESARPLLGIL
jgi:hypothetical protein